MTLHGDSTCSSIGKVRKTNQRDVAINQKSFPASLAQLTGLRFGAEASINDAWLTIEFHDAEFEEAVARYIHRLLSQRYKRFEASPIERHC
jgi:hypothetical protein